MLKDDMMGYRFLDHLTRADVAYEATGKTLEELFRSSGEALIQTMVSDLSTIQERERRELKIRAPQSASFNQVADSLLHDFLQKLIFFKDAELLLLRPKKVQIEKLGNEYELCAELVGEAIDPVRHELIVDVKAVTMHQFQVEQTGEGWSARVVLDV
jgi:SHS2 domain-containing protein